MNKKSDRRNFDRFPITFQMEVAAENSEGEKYQDTTVLENISGEGANFITQQADKYFLGQSLELIIHLPDNDEVKAQMRGKATVIRLDPSSSSVTNGKSHAMSIAVKLDTPLHFERDEVNMQESSE